MRKTFWLTGNDATGDGFQTTYSSFWKMLCYKDTREPVTGEKIPISYHEYIGGY
jgi:hypothetical protein